MTDAVETPGDRRIRVARERAATAVAMRQMNLTYRQIGETLNVSVSRAEQLVTRGLQNIVVAEAVAIQRRASERLAAEHERTLALKALSSPLRAELLIRRALAAWSAHEQERT